MKSQTAIKTNKTIVFKYGGNAMTNESKKQALLTRISALVDEGHRVVIVHGGGPFIQKALDDASIESEFIGGQRKTSPEALKHVEMVLKGYVNGDLVGQLNAMGYKAAGLSGKDGSTVVAKKRYHFERVKGDTEQVDLGRVGDVEYVNPYLIWLLLNNGYIPVIACLAADEQGRSYNINGDVFAGYIAGAMNADEFIVLTDVDGLLMDRTDPKSRIEALKVEDIRPLIDNGVIQGGMLPKVEACATALINGAARAVILNGTEPEQLPGAIAHQDVGTGLTL